jgi:hypothetical protein
VSENTTNLQESKIKKNREIVEFMFVTRVKSKCFATVEPGCYGTCSHAKALS